MTDQVPDNITIRLTFDFNVVVAYADPGERCLVSWRADSDSDKACLVKAWQSLAARCGPMLASWCNMMAGRIRDTGNHMGEVALSTPVARLLLSSALNAKEFGSMAIASSLEGDK